MEKRENIYEKQKKYAKIKNRWEFIIYVIKL